MFTIEDDRLRVGIHPKGAELHHIFHKEHRLDYLWGGDPAFWGKHSPLLFPIVGTLKDNTYFYQDRAYHLPRHGFARDREFVLEELSADSIRLLLRWDAGTLAIFPFSFELRVSYRVTYEGLKTTYRVDNPAEMPLYFSIGGHPAFNLPLTPETVYSDYYLEFDQREKAPRWPISKDGLIESNPVPLLVDSNRLPVAGVLDPAAISANIPDGNGRHRDDAGHHRLPDVVTREFIAFQ